MRRFFAGLVSVVTVLILPVSTYAISESQLNFYAQNNILFYDPSGCGNVAGENNYNYDGSQVFSSAELEAISANQPFYENAANSHGGFPWQILAVLHGREHSFQRSNPENGQGAYQLYSYTRIPGAKELDPEKAFLPAGPISDEEFQRQTDILAGLVNDSYGEGLDLNTDDGIKKMFFRYNGAAKAYIDQALALGFSQSEAENGEGSPYVMNRFDEKRDPTVEPTKSNGTWGQIKRDNEGIEYPANNGFGAFLMYVALGGSSGYCADGALVSGGMNLAQAQEFMAYYKNAAMENQYSHSNVVLDGVTLTYHDSCGSALTNCVALSKWFVGKYTSGDANKWSWPNGKDVTRTLSNYLQVDVMNTPRAYAIFSCTACSSSGYGHTGVVLGVDEANDKIIIGEAGCGSSIDYIGAKERSLTEFMNGDYTYVYLDSILKGDI